MGRLIHLLGSHAFGTHACSRFTLCVNSPLTQSRSGPTASESFIVQGSAYSSFPMTMACSALRLGKHASTAPAVLVPCFALGYDDGGVDVHCLSSLGGGKPQVRERSSKEGRRDITFYLMD